MSYKEGRKWRGVATINEKHLASQALFLSKRKTGGWGITSNSIPDTLLSKSAKTQCIRSRTKPHVFLLVFNYYVTFHGLDKKAGFRNKKLTGSSLPLLLTNIIQESKADPFTGCWGMAIIFIFPVGSPQGEIADGIALETQRGAMDGSCRRDNRRRINCDPAT